MPNKIKRNYIKHDEAKLDRQITADGATCKRLLVGLVIFRFHFSGIRVRFVDVQAQRYMQHDHRRHCRPHVTADVGTAQNTCKNDVRDMVRTKRDTHLRRRTLSKWRTLKWGRGLWKWNTWARFWTCWIARTRTFRYLIAAIKPMCRNEVIVPELVTFRFNLSNFWKQVTIGIWTLTICVTRLPRW